MRSSVFVLLILIAFSASCNFSKEKHSNNASYDCISSSLPEANNIFNSIDSILLESQNVKDLDSDSYIIALDLIKNNRVSINPFTIWHKKSHAMDFFSPANYSKIKKCILSNKHEIKKERLDLYLKALDIPYFREVGPINSNEYVAKALASEMFNNDLDRFFFFYLMWYNIILNYYR